MTTRHDDDWEPTTPADALGQVLGSCLQAVPWVTVEHLPTFADVVLCGLRWWGWDVTRRRIGASPACACADRQDVAA